ncbi:hypothetical protein Q0Z83_049650 [Actinoplanes sichuanensis]|nr:hypothetical protein Q0Z83_049650 [Actinoplanes sichuanensis]
MAGADDDGSGDEGVDAAGDGGMDAAGDDGADFGSPFVHPARPASRSVARTIDVYDLGNGVSSALDGIGNRNCPSNRQPAPMTATGS